MTEQQWLTAAEPQAMLEWLSATGRADERKLRLLSCAGVRRVWHLLADDRSRRAVEVAERHADGQAGDQELALAADAAQQFASLAAGESNVTAPSDLHFGALCITHARCIVDSFAGGAAFHTAYWYPWLDGADNVIGCLDTAAWVAASASTCERYSSLASCDSEAAARELQFEAGVRAERAAQATLLRCVFGNPFRAAPAIEPAWLRWNDGCLVKIARAIYDGRRFKDLPILADALVDAGCANPDLLEHCRLQKGHVRGCWVVDLILDRW